MAAAKVAVFVKQCNALPSGATGGILYTLHSASNATSSTNRQHHTDSHKMAQLLGNVRIRLQKFKLIITQIDRDQQNSKSGVDN